MEKEKWPKISIVTPSYNQAQYLEQTIASVISQGYPELEYIVMDGGSTDGSVEIIKKYQDKIHTWVSKKDNGQADAVKNGFAMATGEIWTFLNSDDVLAENALWTVARNFKEDPALDVLIGAGGMIDVQGNFLYGSYPLGWNKYLLLSLQSRYMQPAVFFTARAYRQSGGINPDMQFCLDFEYFVRLAEGKYKSKIMHRKLAFTRLHSFTKTANWQHVSDKEKMEIYKHYKFKDYGLGYMFFCFSCRIKHFLIRSYIEGVFSVCQNRSNKAMRKHSKGSASQ